MSTSTVPGRALATLIAAVWLAAAGPAAGQTLEFDEIAMLPGPVDLVELSGGRAYVAAERKLTIFDLSDPTAPRRRGSYTFPENIWSLAVADTLVYIAADLFGLGILDVSDPDTPQLLGSARMPGQVKDVDVSGRTAVLADHMSGIDLVDVSDVRAPAVLGSVYLDGYCRDVAVLGSIAYAVDDPTGFYVLDLQETGSWEPTSALQSADGPRMVEVSETASTPLAVLLGHGRLQVYDLSNPIEPAYRSAYATPGNALRVELDGDLAYVADGTLGMLVVGLEDPSSPRVAGSHLPAQPVRDVAVDDDLALLAVGPLPNTVGRSRAGGSGDGDVIVLRRR